MSDLFKKFKSVFLEETPETNKKQASAEVAAAPSAPAAPVVVATSGAVTDKFVDILMAALEKNNQPGFDYFEFRMALKNLSSMPMDEQTRFQSAYAMAKTMGVTAAQLTESAKHYLNVLVGEEGRFNEAHAQQRARLIGNREEEVKNLEAMMKHNAEQIAQLTQQIEQHRQRCEQIRTEVSESTVKIENTKADFAATYHNITANLTADIEKMAKYFK